MSAYCKADSNHKARCYCPESFRGDPYSQCERPECISDDDCPFNLACKNERCEDPCNCGLGAVCNVNYHRAQCSCPPGYVGNPLAVCNIGKKSFALSQNKTSKRQILETPQIQPQCRVDADCPSKLACFSGVCKNPCVVTEPCGINAQCSVVDTLPLRTMSCLCLPGYVGDADLECKKGIFSFHRTLRLRKILLNIFRFRFNMLYLSFIPILFDSNFFIFCSNLINTCDLHFCKLCRTNGRSRMLKQPRLYLKPSLH